MGSFDLPRGVIILPYSGNTGFGQGINRAVEASDTELILITNPDTLPKDRSSLRTLEEEHEKGTISAGITIDARGKGAPSTGVWPELPWVRDQLLRSARPLWRCDRFDWLQGSLLMVRRDDFLLLGGFTGSYPLYFEDVDLSAKAEEAGIRRVLNPDSVFVHKEGTGSEGARSVRLAGFHWGMCEFFRYHRPLQYPGARRYVIAKCLLRAAIYLSVSGDSCKGYVHALKAILHNRVPGLPERSHG